MDIAGKIILSETTQTPKDKYSMLHLKVAPSSKTLEEMLGYKKHKDVKPT